MSNPVPYPPYYVSATNISPESTHPDVAVFQAAMVRNLNAPLDITGTYDAVTQYAVKVVDRVARREGIVLADNGRVNGNLIRLIGLVERPEGVLDGYLADQ